jgi:hypothetical protein
MRYLPCTIIVATTLPPTLGPKDGFMDERRDGAQAREKWRRRTCFSAMASCRKGDNGGENSIACSAFKGDLFGQ